MKKEFLSTSMPKLIMVVSLIVGIGAVFGVLGYYRTVPKDKVVVNERIEKKEIKNEKVAQHETECPENWKEYKHDIIGIKFCYPEEWGKPATKPKRNITKLEDVVSEFNDNEHNDNYNSFFIEFENNENISFRFFNEQYGGEYYPNALAFVYGYIDNITLLKSTEDICEYKIDFNKMTYTSKLNEIYSECDKNIKTTAIEHYQFFDFIEDVNKSRYSYELKWLAYKKLSNGYFDNLLISAQFGYVSQNKERLTTFDQILSSLGKSNIQFQKEKNEFASFVNSIEIYQPIHEILQEFKAVEGEDSQITTIRKYYWFLSNNKLSEAYEMRFDKNKTNYQEFYDWYKDVNYAKSYDFKKTNSNEYEFYVEYQDHNEPKTKFKVGMFVNGNEIKTLFSDEILTKEIIFDKYSAYAVKRGNKNYMILAENGKEIIIDKGDANYSSKYTKIRDVKHFYGLKFSPNGNYLIYSMEGWEWMNSYVYNINNGKRVYEFMTDGSQGFDFTPDENYFYVCSSPGMGSDMAGVIYKVPDFKNKYYDIFNDPKNSNYMNIYCEYDDVGKAVLYTLIDEDGNEKKVKYFLTID